MNSAPHRSPRRLVPIAAAVVAGDCGLAELTDAFVRRPDVQDVFAKVRIATRGDQLPVFAFTTTAEVAGWDVFALSRVMRERGWQIPAYTFPPDREDLSVLRIVCRNGFSHDLAEVFVTHLRAAVDQLNADAGRRGRNLVDLHLRVRIVRVDERGDDRSAGRHFVQQA